MVGSAVSGDVDYPLDLCHGTLGPEVCVAGVEVAAGEDAAGDSGADEACSEVSARHGPTPGVQAQAFFAAAGSHRKAALVIVVLILLYVVLP